MFGANTQPPHRRHTNIHSLSTDTACGVKNEISKALHSIPGSQLWSTTTICKLSESGNYLIIDNCGSEPWPFWRSAMVTMLPVSAERLKDHLRRSRNGARYMRLEALISCPCPGRKPSQRNHSTISKRRRTGS